MAKRVTVTSYTHRDPPCGDRWQPGGLEAYCEAKTEALRIDRRADDLYELYLSDRLDDAGDAAAVQASFWLDRLAWGQWREVARLWKEGEL